MSFRIRIRLVTDVHAEIERIERNIGVIQASVSTVKLIEKLSIIIGFSRFSTRNFRLWRPFKVSTGRRPKPSVTWTNRRRRRRRRQETSLAHQRNKKTWKTFIVTQISKLFTVFPC